MNNSTLERYADYVVNHPWRIMLLSILVIMFFASGGRFLQFTNDFRQFFSEENPQLIAFDEMEETFSKADNVMFLVAPDDGNVFTKNTLAIIEELTEKSWQLPFSSRVDSISNYQHTVAQDDDLVVGDLVEDAQNLSPQQLATIRQVSVNEPLLLHRLISPKGHVAAVNVTVQLPRQGLNEVVELVAAARDLKDEILASHPNINRLFSGLMSEDSC